MFVKLTQVSTGKALHLRPWAINAVVVQPDDTCILLCDENQEFHVKEKAWVVLARKDKAINQGEATVAEEVTAE